MSEDGCFIHTLAVPSIAEPTVVKILFSPDQTIELKSRVLYVERGMGFAVTFDKPSAEAADDLHRILTEIRAGTAPKR